MGPMIGREAGQSILSSHAEQESPGRKADDRRRRLRIAVPIAAGELSPRFGACDEVRIFEVDKQTKQILHSLTYKVPVHTAGRRFHRLKELHTDVVLAADIPGLARHVAEQEGIEVVLCVSPRSPEQIVLDYLNRKTKTKATGTHGE
ncbi:MAG: ATPase [Planctomycetes bacterium]|nr:ATPase [Planctomycetota bacterium]